jgi:integrase
MSDFEIIEGALDEWLEHRISEGYINAKTEKYEKALEALTRLREPVQVDVERVLKPNAVIRLHDLRAKTASDFEDEKDAQALLAHENLSMTKAYIRKPQTVKPLK